MSNNNPNANNVKQPKWKQEINNRNAPPPKVARDNVSRAVRFPQLPTADKCRNVLNPRLYSSQRWFDVPHLMTTAQVEMLQSMLPGYHFNLLNMYKYSDHPVSHNVRTAMAMQALDNVSSYLEGLEYPARIVDIGGKDGLWRNDMWYENIICTNPTLDFADVLRHSSSHCCDCKFPVECASCQDADVYLSIHSLYYLNHEDVLEAVHRAKQGVMVAIVHPFDGPCGKTVDGEFSWRKDFGTPSIVMGSDAIITMVSEHGGWPYQHRDISWVFRTNYYSDSVIRNVTSFGQPGRAMTWSVLNNPNGTSIIKFVRAPVDLGTPRHSIGFYPTEAQDLIDTYNAILTREHTTVVQFGGVWMAVPFQGSVIEVDVRVLHDMVAWWQGKVIDGPNIKASLTRVAQLCKDHRAPDHINFRYGAQTSALAARVAVRNVNGAITMLRDSAYEVQEYNDNVLIPLSTSPLLDKLSVTAPVAVYRFLRQTPFIPVLAGVAVFAYSGLWRYITPTALSSGLGAITTSVTTFLAKLREMQNTTRTSLTRIIPSPVKGSIMDAFQGLATGFGWSPLTTKRCVTFTSAILGVYELIQWYYGEDGILFQRPKPVKITPKDSNVNFWVKNPPVKADSLSIISWIKSLGGKVITNLDRFSIAAKRRRAYNAIKAACLRDGKVNIYPVPEGHIDYNPRAVASYCVSQDKADKYEIVDLQKHASEIVLPGTARIKDNCRASFGSALVGIGLGSFTPLVARSCTHNELRAVSSRVTRDTLQPHPNFWIDAYNYMTLNNADTGPDGSGLPIHIVPDEEQWLASLEPAQRERYVLGRVVETDMRVARHECFIKRENNIKGFSWNLPRLTDTDSYVYLYGVHSNGELQTMTPRAIQGCTPYSNLTLGPFISRYSHELGERTLDKRIGVAYAWKAEDIELWMEHWSSEISNPILLSMDVVRFDASVSLEAHDYKIKMYRDAKMGREALRLLKTERVVRGRTFGGIKYSVRATQPSGRQETSGGNSQISHAIFHMALCKMLANVDLTKKNRQYWENFAALLMSDDSVCLLDPTCWQGQLAILIETFNEAGFDVTWNATEYLPAAEFLSSRWWPDGMGGYNFAPKPFRQLAKLFWTCDSSVTDPLVQARAIALSTAHLVGMPVLGKAIKKVLELTIELGDVPHEDYLRYHPSSGVEWESAAYAMCEIYGITISEIRALEELIDKIDHLPATIDSAILNRCVAIDAGLMSTALQIAPPPEICEEVENYANYTRTEPPVKLPWWSPLKWLAGFASTVLTVRNPVKAAIGQALGSVHPVPPYQIGVGMPYKNERPAPGADGVLAYSGGPVVTPQGVVVPDDWPLTDSNAQEFINANFVHWVNHTVVGTAWWAAFEECWTAGFTNLMLRLIGDQEDTWHRLAREIAYIIPPFTIAYVEMTYVHGRKASFLAHGLLYLARRFGGVSWSIPVHVLNNVLAHMYMSWLASYEGLRGAMGSVNNAPTHP